jgi:hypothetical protein
MNCGAAVEWGMGLSIRHFLHWLCHSPICAGPTPRPTKPAMLEIGRGRGIGEGASQRADAALSTMVETWGGGDGFVHKGGR